MLAMASQTASKNQREQHFVCNSQKENETRPHMRKRSVYSEPNSDLESNIDVYGKKNKVTIEGETNNVEGTLVKHHKISDSNTRKRKLQANQIKNKVPTKLKELLETGLLESVNVHYIHSLKNGQTSNVLCGTIKGTGIMCFCLSCDGGKVLRPGDFELHAGSSNKRPADYIFLETSNSLRDVLNACKNIQVDCIINFISFAIRNKFVFCNTCKGPIFEGCSNYSTVLCGACSNPNSNDALPTTFNYEVATVTENIDRIEVNSTVGHEEPETTIVCNQGHETLDLQPQRAKENSISFLETCETQDSQRDNEKSTCFLKDCETQDTQRGSENLMSFFKDSETQNSKDLSNGSYDRKTINYSLNALSNLRDLKLPASLIDAVKKNLSLEEFNGDDLNITWRVLKGTDSSISETRQVFANALSILYEEYGPILLKPDTQNIISHLLFGGNLHDMELGDMQCADMHCAVLNVNSKIVACAVFRVFNKELAEILLIAEGKDSEGKGYLRCLYACIEKYMKELGVKNLMLSADEKMKAVWIMDIGFGVMSEELNGLKTMYPLMHLDGTTLLRKFIGEF